MPLDSTLATPTAPSSATNCADEGASAAPRRRWHLLAFVALAQLMVLLDATVVNLALPKIQQDLGAGASAIEWVLTGYILCFGGLMLLGGRTADRWGRRRTFLVGATVFILASLACGLAGSAGLLIAARAAQGCGAAFLSPAAMSLVTTTFTAGRERTTALGVWAALAGLGATLGVILGGLITDSLSWRWIFFINIPIGVAAAVGTWLLDRGRPDNRGRAWDANSRPSLSLGRDRPDNRGPARDADSRRSLGLGRDWPDDRGPERRADSGRPAQHPSNRRANRPANRPDILGAITATGSLALLVYGIVNIQDKGWSSPWCLIPLSAAVVLGASFIWTERRVADPLVPLHLFATRSLRAAGLGRFLTSAVQASILFLTSYYLQRTLGYSTLRAGLAFLPLGLVAIVVTTPATRLLHRYGPRPIYLVGAAGSTLALLWLAQLPEHGSYLLHLLPALLVLGVSMQCCGIPVNVHGVSEIPLDKQGLASGVLTAAFQIGASLGIAVIATSALSRTGHALAAGTGTNLAWLDGLHFGYMIAAGISCLNLLNAVFGFRRQRSAGQAPPAP